MDDGRTGFWVRLAGVGLPVLAVLILAEILVRVTGLSSTNYRMVYEDTVVKSRPGASYVYRKENRNLVRFNNEGFHDRDWRAGGDAYGILFLGDSMTEGKQVAVDSLFTSRLEDRLRSVRMDVDVMNAAVSATGTGHQYLLWKTYIRDSGVRVDRLVLCFFPQNDLKGNHAGIGKGPETYGVYLGPEGRPWVQRDEPIVKRVVRKVTKRSALVDLVYTRLHYLVRGMERPDNIEDEEGDGNWPDPTGSGASSDESGGSVSADYSEGAVAYADTLWAESMRRTLRLIERWNREAEAEGVEFSVVIIPSTDQNNFYEDEVARRLLRADDEGEFDVLRLTLEGRDPSETNSFGGERIGHLNELGHSLVARELYDWLTPALERALSDSADGS